MSEDSSGDMNRTRVFMTGAFQSPAAPVEEREHYLVVVEGARAGERIRLQSTPLRFGRALSCDFVVPDTEASGQHCEISAVPSDVEALVTDLRSTNGCYVEGRRIEGAARLASGALLQIGRHVFRHEWLFKGEAHKAQELGRDLEKARHYVQSLLPPPISSGPVLTDWVYEPSTQLGGDAFGYLDLGGGLLAAYLIDVSGHGVGAAMHSVSVMNVMRQRALPSTDFSDPAQVLASLNAMFQMESHDGMYFSIWYGVYDTVSRSLVYASGGHHPAYLATPGTPTLAALKTRSLIIGATPAARFSAARVEISPGARLYVFSDGVFEIVTRDGTQWALEDIIPLLQAQPEAGVTESQRLYRKVRDAARPGPLDDDFSMVVVTFS
ncbi:MAG: SpoIIE family protein phosphatase [Pseudomonadota bacterium]